MNRCPTLSLLACAAIALVACNAEAPVATASSPVTSPVASTVAAGGVAGTYKIASATNPGGGGGYAGAVTVAPHGDHFTLAWDITNAPAFKGVGIVEGSTLGVGWGTGTNYGVAVYKVSGGTLTGKWATYTNQGKVGTETLIGPAGLSGDYQIGAATFPVSGKAYVGTVSIVPQGQSYAVTWKLPHETYSGVGILKGDVFVVGWGTGGGGAGVVAYGIAGGKLDGVWGQPGSNALGTEVLARN